MDSPSRPPLLREDRHVRVTDLGAATYLFMSGLCVVSAEEVWKTNGRSICEFVFYDPDTRAEQLVVDYTNDKQIAAYENASDRLRKLLNRFHGRNKSQPKR